MSVWDMAVMRVRREESMGGWGRGLRRSRSLRRRGSGEGGVEKGEWRRGSGEGVVEKGW